jgi:hypothetical protein
VTPELRAIAERLEKVERQIAALTGTSEPATSKPEAKGLSISTRLQAAANELHELEQLVKSADFDAHVLRDFRGAIDHVRTTAWAVQQWIGLKEKGGDAYAAVLPVLSGERVRRTTQLAKDLLVDLENVDVGIETEGIKGLIEAVNGLHACLAHLYKGKS